MTNLIKQNTALAPFEPTNIIEAMKLAETLSSSSLVPTSLRGKPSDVLVVMMKGRELGLPPMAALANIHVIEGKAVCSSDLMQGIVLASGKCKYFRLVESTADRCTYETERRDTPGATRITWTREDAQRANLLSKDNWRKYPAAMLRARCAADLARDVYPDVAAGLYETDEGDDFRKREPVATEVEVIRPPQRPDSVSALKDQLRAKLAPATVNIQQQAQAVAANPDTSIFPSEFTPAADESLAEPIFPELIVANPVQPTESSADGIPPEWTQDPACWYDPSVGGIDPDSAEIAKRLKISARMGEKWNGWCSETCWRGARLGKFTPEKIVLGSEGGGRHKALQAAVEFAVQQVASGKVPEMLGIGALAADYCLAMMEHRYEVFRQLGADTKVGGSEGD
jgi:hypothetical protein